MPTQQRVGMRERMALALRRLNKTGKRYLGHLWFVAARRVARQESVDVSLIRSAVEVSAMLELLGAKILMAARWMYPSHGFRGVHLLAFLVCHGR
jgi:hypothetical protein